MIVSWNWLKDYVSLDMSPGELEHRLAMSGLNHEGSEKVGDDLAIDLEVTSNRPDCLGHLGVAREIAVLWERKLEIPQPIPTAADTKHASDLIKVSIRCPDLCYRYSARVIRGIRVGPSPSWLADRLRTIGIEAINNVVDVTNYVLMECGQPLHAFDYGKVAGPEIVVRESRKGEQFQAINHKTYELEPGMCVIGDARRSVALGGVMGGADTEVSDATTDVLIESAEFAPLSIRSTARALNLHSPSSYRFERGVDPEGVDWASCRCCQLILDLAGGRLADGVVDVGTPRRESPPIVLRLSQLKRILGIEIPEDEVKRILTALGNRLIESNSSELKLAPPSWRRDLTREIDLVEEIARIHGYDEIPEDVGVPMVPSHRTDADRVLERARSVLSAAGFDEAMTRSVVSSTLSQSFSPWTDAPPIRCNTPMVKGAAEMRRSLVPSLLDVRRINESLANEEIELYETAKIYLPHDGRLPDEQWTLGVTTGRDFHGLKGVVEKIVALLNPAARLEVLSTAQSLFDPDRSCELKLDGQRLGFLGRVSDRGLKAFKLRAPTVVAELSLDRLCEIANLIPQYVAQSSFPSMSRDLNLVVDESLRWTELATTVRDSAGEELEELRYQETYRDTDKDGPGKKRLLFSIRIRSTERTLTGEEADRIRDEVVAACRRRHDAVLLA